MLISSFVSVLYEFSIKNYYNAIELCVPNGFGKNNNVICLIWIVLGEKQSSCIQLITATL